MILLGSIAIILIALVFVGIIAYRKRCWSPLHQKQASLNGNHYGTPADMVVGRNGVSLPINRPGFPGDYDQLTQENQYPNGGPWSKDGKGMMQSYFLHDKHDIQNNSMRGSSSPATTIMNNNSQDLYAEVSDVAMTSGLMSTFHTQQPGLQNQFNGDPEPYATTTLAMQNTNARLLNGNLFMSLPQEDSFMNRQNYRSNIGLTENPIGTSFDTSQNHSLFQKSQPNFLNQNLSNAMETNLKQQNQLKNVSSGNYFLLREQFLFIILYNLMVIIMI